MSDDLTVERVVQVYRRVCHEAAHAVAMAHAGVIVPFGELDPADEESSLGRAVYRAVARRIDQLIGEGETEAAIETARNAAFVLMAGETYQQKWQQEPFIPLDDDQRLIEGLHDELGAWAPRWDAFHAQATARADQFMADPNIVQQIGELIVAIGDAGYLCEADISELAASL